MRLVAWLGSVVLPLLLAGFGLSLVRLVKGPTLPDRVVAVELMASIAAGVVAVYAVLEGRAAYLDAALILALLSFLGAVAFAYYIERRA